MKRNLSRLSDEDLRDLFEDLDIRQGDAWAPEDPKALPRYTKLYFEILDVVTELQSRPGDARRILIPLLDDENWQVASRRAPMSLLWFRNRPAQPWNGL